MGNVRNVLVPQIMIAQSVFLPTNCSLARPHALHLDVHQANLLLLTQCAKSAVPTATHAPLLPATVTHALQKQAVLSSSKAHLVCRCVPP